MTLDMNYVEWLAHLIMENADSPNFVFGPLDQKRLAGALLSILPVVRAAEEWRPTVVDAPPITLAQQELIRAIDAMRSAPLHSTPPHNKRGGRT